MLCQMFFNIVWVNHLLDFSMPWRSKMSEDALGANFPRTLVVIQSILKDPTSPVWLLFLQCRLLSLTITEPKRAIQFEDRKLEKNISSLELICVRANTNISFSQDMTWSDHLSDVVGACVKYFILLFFGPARASVNRAVAENFSRFFHFFYVF